MSLKLKNSIPLLHCSDHWHQLSSLTLRDPINEIRWETMSRFRLQNTTPLLFKKPSQVLDKRIQLLSCWWINSIKVIGNWVKSQMKEFNASCVWLDLLINSTKQITDNSPAALCWSHSKLFDSMLFDSIKQTNWVKSHLGESNASSALC